VLREIYVSRTPPKIQVINLVFSLASNIRVFGTVALDRLAMLTVTSDSQHSWCL